jgi:hypothetical protein
MRSSEFDSNNSVNSQNDTQDNRQIVLDEKKQSTGLPLYDTYDPRADENPGYRIKVARDFEDMAKVFAIRASACFSDPEHLYNKHFDGNDFSATHLIGYVDGEPVGTIRIRYFADFTRIERLTVRPTHRKSRIAFKLAKAREELVPFWSMLGFRITEGKEPIFIYGLPHFDMTLAYDQLPDAISDQSNPLVLLRPEGRWKEAGHHESAKVTAPVAITPGMIPERARKPRDIAIAMARSGDRTDERKKGMVSGDETHATVPAALAGEQAGQQRNQEMRQQES